MHYNFNLEKDRNNFFKKYKYNKIDFLIVGSGPAGISLANELNKNCKNCNIVNLEKGNFTNEKKEKVLSKNLNIKLESRVFKVGGTSNTWGSGSTYFENFEMHERLRGDKKNLWPIKHSMLLKLYSIVKKNYELKIPVPTKNQIKQRFHEREVFIPKKHINFKNFLDLNKIDLVSNCNIEYFGERKKTFCFIKKDSLFKKIESDYLILTTGTLEAIKLIFNSVKNNRIKSINKKVLGRYFMNHPKIRFGKLTNLKKGVNLNNHIIHNCKDIRKFTALSLPLKTQKKNKFLNSCVRFFPVKETFYKNLIHLSFKKKNILEFVNNLFNLFLLKISKKLNLNINREIYKMIFHLEMEPNYNNRVYLKNKTIVADYKLSKRDIDTFFLLYTEVIKNFSSSYNINNIKNKFKKLNLNKICLDASHHMGGTCYNPNSKKSFIDKKLKILGLKRTYICSSSIFPTSGSLSPTATIVALSIYLAKELSKKIKKS